MPLARQSPDSFRSLTQLANGVARSFAISLRALPSALRTPVTLAYLLARASDAVADSVNQSMPLATDVAKRVQALDDLGRAIERSSDNPDRTDFDLPTVLALIQSVPDPKEQQLLSATPELLSILSRQNTVDRALIAEVCQTIVSGQRLDLTRFGMAGPQVHALAHTRNLHDYTWRVAGCVGPFWTRMCESHLGDWRRAEWAAMLQAAGEYGRALQRLNILRDSAADLRQGRCYWPENELQAVGWTPQQLAINVRHARLEELVRMQPLMQQWIAQTRLGLGHGLAYCQAIRPWRLRWASALPALIGLRTLECIEALGPLALTQAVKVERRWIKGLLLRLVLGAGTPSGLLKLGRELGLPRDACILPALDGTIQP